jgi:hypothetical protein
MSADPERLPDELARALDRLADEDAARVLAQARAGATARAQALLEEALVTRLLARALPQAPAAPATGAAAEPPAVAEAESESAGSDSAQPGDEEILYLYGVMRADAPTPANASGVGPDSPVGLVVAGDLAAVISRVPASEFGDEHLKQNLERMEWLERTARRHEAVLETIREHATVIPMRMCTLFRSAESVREMLEREYEPLERALDRLIGRNEWGVKALVDLAVVRRRLATDTGASMAPDLAASGRGYLESKQAERRSANETRAWVRETATAVHEALTAAAASASRNPPQPRELTGYEDEMVLNGAYLVADDEVERFSALVAELDERHRPEGLRLELTGPWPPYNFVPPLAAA